MKAEQVYLKPQVTNLKNKKITANPKPQTQEKKSLNPKQQTLNPKPKKKFALNPKP